MKGVDMMYFYLLDLERTFWNSTPYFWNGNRHGYTTSLEHAGLFTRKVAEKLVSDDLSNVTVMISQEVVFNILGEDMKPHEGITT